MTDIHQIIKKWVDSGKTAETRCELFDAIRSSYTYAYFDHPDYLKHILSHMNAMNEINSNTKLIIAGKHLDSTAQNLSRIDSPFNRNIHSNAPRTYSSVDNVLNSLVLRYPVFYGNPVKGAYSPQLMKDALGYDPSYLPTITPPCYAIMGPAFTSAKEIPKFWVLHTWGVNLENSSTFDAQRFVKNGILNRPAYHEAVYDMLKLIFTGAMHIEGPVVIKLPLIGLGAFINACPPRDKEFAIQIFFEGVVDILTMLRSDQIVVELMVFEESYCDYQVFKKWHLSPYTQALIKNHSLIIRTGPKWGNLFRTHKWPSTDFNVILVNAWDSRSFIGNGGSKDKTIDGAMVSSTGPGKELPNSSFFHNPFFSTKLLNPHNWLIF